MSTIQSKVTAQGQISVPAEVRRQLGVGPGSVLVWEWRDGEFVVRRAGRTKPTDVKARVRDYIRRKHARG